MNGIELEQRIFLLRNLIIGQRVQPKSAHTTSIIKAIDYNTGDVQIECDCGKCGLFWYYAEDIQRLYNRYES
jgi:hypothetical protein